MQADIVAALLLIHLAGIAQAGTANDFSVSGNHLQQVALDGIDTVVLRCHCPERQVRRLADGQRLELRIHGTHDSIGHHGRQEKPGALAGRRLAFAELRQDRTLLLESYEYTSMHHALLVTQLQIDLPSRIRLRIEPLEYPQLELHPAARHGTPADPVARPRQDDFSVSGEFMQRFALDGIDTVVVRCHCRNRVALPQAGDAGLELLAYGIHDSQGYHGSQSKPTALDPAVLQFDARRKGRTLLLRSREYLRIHHAALIERLRVKVPTDREVRFEMLTQAELESHR